MKFFQEKLVNILRLLSKKIITLKKRIKQTKFFSSIDVFYKKYLLNYSLLEKFFLKKKLIWNIYNLSRKIIIYIKDRKIILIPLLIILFFYIIIFLIPLKDPLFKTDYSTVLKDKNGSLLGAYISDDQQWRFPLVEKIPFKYKKCLLLFEDKNFYLHPGIDPSAIVRALFLNIKAKKIVSGGSTISMQVIRISRQGKRRTIQEKIIEAFLTLKLEFRYSKNKILQLYASHAPLGGNVIGIEAAAWRYFGRSLDNLSWADAALLAVLPNSPSLMHPGKNIEELKEKRDKLLMLLYQKKIIKLDEYELSKDEQIPEEPHPIPQKAFHLLMRSINEGYKGKTIISSIDSNLQSFSNRIIEKHHNILKGAKIFNAACIIVKVDTGEVLAYVGNAKIDDKERHGNFVDIITSNRSPGSLLKPILYAFSIDEGLILPNQLLPDIPLVYEGFSPKNFGKSYDGVISADKALSRSLNIPFVCLLRDYGYQKFYHRLEQLGIKFSKPASHYSLSLILGSADLTLWDLTSFYSSFARVLKNYHNFIDEKNYSNSDYFKNRYIALTKEEIKELKRKKKYKKNDLLGAAAIWFTFEAMKEVVRPDEELKWQYFSSSKPIAWKTGTSYGNRDAWAIGITSEYVVGVWVGNADGEGRPEIKGVKVAGPILFDIFDILPDFPWFKKPTADMAYEKICKSSGMLASRICDDVVVLEVPKNASRTLPCKYHRIVHLDKEEKTQVDSSSYPIDKMIHKSWFVLPPIQEMYYKKKNNTYKVLPKSKFDTKVVMELVYPSKPTKIFVPIELDGTPGKTVFELAHRRPETIIYWHLDGIYMGETKNIHQMGFYPNPGKHELVIIDEAGNQLIQQFEIISRRK